MKASGLLGSYLISVSLNIKKSSTIILKKFLRGQMKGEHHLKTLQ